MINIDNTGRWQTLKQRTSYNCIHSSSNRNPAVGEKWNHFNIRFWSKWLKNSYGGAQQHTWGCSTAHMGVLNSTHGGAQQHIWGCSTAHMGVLNSTHGGAQQHTKACKLFWSRLQMFLRDIWLEADNRLFSQNLKQGLTVGIRLVLQNQFNYVFGLRTSSTWWVW